MCRHKGVNQQLWKCRSEQKKKKLLSDLESVEAYKAASCYYQSHPSAPANKIHNYTLHITLIGPTEVIGNPWYRYHWLHYCFCSYLQSGQSGRPTPSRQTVKRETHKDGAGRRVRSESKYFFNDQFQQTQGRRPAQKHDVWFSPVVEKSEFDSQTSGEFLHQEEKYKMCLSNRIQKGRSQTQIMFKKLFHIRLSLSDKLQRLVSGERADSEFIYQTKKCT